MNDSPSGSKSQCNIISKYFSGKPVMDESLSDFQEKKKCSTGHKKSTKPTKTKAKTIKRIRGQKDIRTAIKPKKNELVAYANDFDKVCKQSGIDVDPEQLQVAIALSKSLQTAENCESQSSESQNSQERTGKIRTTLLEYGFKVPEIKINVTRKKRQKKKNYKLLLTSEAEKQQIISDKYAQALLDHLDNSKVFNDCHTNDISSIKLYHIATQESYSTLKYDSSFYIENLALQSQNTVGSLLRDWSNIPGRPASPVIEASDVNFTEIDCSDDELISVLSGSITSAQEIIKNKHRLLEAKAVNIDTKSEKNIVLEDTTSIKLETNNNNTATTSKMDINHDVLEIEESNPIIIIEEPTSCKTYKQNLNNSIEIIDIDGAELKTLPLKIRSCSPDIFDDEVSSILDNSKENMDTISQDLPLCIKTTSNEVMDLTECVNVISHKVLTSIDTTNEQPISQLSQPSNVTKRKSNDFMEITNCVAGSSQPLIVNNVENIDLTQHSDDKEITIVENDTEKESKVVGNLDLTQSSNTDDELPFVQVSGKRYDSLDETVLLNEDAYNCVNLTRKPITSEKQDTALDSTNFIETDLKENEPDLEIFPVTTNFEDKHIVNNLRGSTNQNISNSSRDKTTEKSKTESFFEEFVHVHSDDESEELVEDIVGLNDSGKDFIYNDEGNNENIDLTQNLDSYKSTDNKTTHQTSSQNNAAVYNNDNDQDIDLTQSTDSEKTVDEKTIRSQNKAIVDNTSEQYDHNIDLIQNTDTSKTSDDITDTTRSPQMSLEGLGKVGDVSIDYDEIFDDVVESYASTSKQSDYSKSLANDCQNESTKSKNKSNSDVISNCSQYSEVFEIVDQELEYSLNKSRHDYVDNFDFGGISIMDDISKVRGSKSTANEEFIANHDLGKSMNDSLPMVYIKGTKYDPKTVSTESPNKPSIASTPYRNKITEGIAIETPTNSEYVIKTDQVTPLLDYASMTTPERNKELGKFGLKPFKRKRAIQLLTHLYNQTHPTIESCSADDLPSPSKKLKTNHTLPKPSPKKIKSPMKGPALEPPIDKIEKYNDGINVEGIDKENDVYEITNETPDIRDIESFDEDWVFQKREKAKLHSCRVPLHIAFHNYVSSRRGLREAILRYDPVNIDLIHKGLVASGHRYDPKDLLKFMDKKCITVKTTDNNSRNNKKH